MSLWGLVLSVVSFSMRRFPGYGVWCIFGAGGDKDCKGMFEVILASKIVTCLVLVQSAHAKALPVQALQELLPAEQPTSCLVVTDKPHPDSAFTWALRELAAPGEKEAQQMVVVVCGSFYVVSAIRAILSAKQPLLFAPEDPVWETGL